MFNSFPNIIPQDATRILLEKLPTHIRNAIQKKKVEWLGMNGIVDFVKRGFGNFPRALREAAVEYLKNTHMSSFPSVEKFFQYHTWLTQVAELQDIDRMESLASCVYPRIFDVYPIRALSYEELKKELWKNFEYDYIYRERIQRGIKESMRKQKEMYQEEDESVDEGDLTMEDDELAFRGESSQAESETRAEEPSMQMVPHDRESTPAPEEEASERAQSREVSVESMAEPVVVTNGKERSADQSAKGMPPPTRVSHSERSAETPPGQATATTVLGTKTNANGRSDSASESLKRKASVM